MIAATNASLPELVERKLFREDLFYRLNIFPIQLPALRERQGDVEKLATVFAKRFSPRSVVSRAALDKLEQHRWPGNVRELRNVMERAGILADDSGSILPQHIFL